MVDHGISEAALDTIRAVLATCGDEITQVDLFGSRAVGRYRRRPPSCYRRFALADCRRRPLHAGGLIP